MSARGQGRVFKQKGSSVWSLDYSVNGRRIRESSGTRKKKEAVRLLNGRLAHRGNGRLPRDLEKVMFEDLKKLILDDYRRRQRKSADRLELSLAHLEQHFGGWRVVDIRKAAIDAYATDRTREGAAPATVNRELAALRRMLNLGREAELV